MQKMGLMLSMFMLSSAFATALPQEITAQYRVLSEGFTSENPQLIKQVVSEHLDHIDLDGVHSGLQALLGTFEPGALHRLDFQNHGVEVLDFQPLGYGWVVEVQRVVSGRIVSPGAAQEFTTTVTQRDTWEKEKGRWKIIRTQLLKEQSQSEGMTRTRTAYVPLDTTSLQKISKTLKPHLWQFSDNVETFPTVPQLNALLDGARVVGMGEGSHGTHEHFQLKLQLLKHLVEHHGFTVFAIEADLDDTYTIEQYVQGKGGSAEMATRSFDFWIWNTFEMQALLQWIHDHNQKRGTRPAVHVVGFDLQDPLGSLQLLSQWEGQLPEPVKAALRELLSTPADQWHITQASAPEMRKHMQELSNWAASLNPLGEETPYLQLLVRSILQGVELQSSSGLMTSQLRDRFMAENVRWVQDRLYPDQKMMLWAHNLHIAKAQVQNSGVVPMGQHLAEQLGDQYRAWGLTFPRGSIRVLDGQMQKVAHLQLPPVPADSLSALMAPPVGWVTGLNVQQAAQNRALLEWLADHGTVQTSGHLAYPDMASWSQINLVAAFDAVFSTEKSTPARALP
ncbi:erythromycin esterase family protein [Deinococcus cellulosilyticus]|uniref:Erythromycin esterase n=1 Tax=Deinococcus cellulosilyticus (strain DSM 18568 / NBRC 106333 / KACC 11606 / 5516J-15) TaxID=1223518 RepID=A0A511N634_DEIC1|nr:erythromycin esterase family protein [Deinococcus cellulosilyticus]GEM48313.1 erythromycin esterase [Deinococcus cellulosilyticus NBRC 106333 = KACC 11606]